MERNMEEQEQVEESDEEMKGVDSKLKQSLIDRETKLIIHNKMEEYEV